MLTAQARHCSSFALFVDVRRAFYSVVVGIAAGPTLGRDSRRAVWDALGAEREQAARVEAQAVDLSRPDGSGAKYFEHGG